MKKLKKKCRKLSKYGWKMEKNSPVKKEKKNLVLPSANSSCPPPVEVVCCFMAVWTTSLTPTSLSSFDPHEPILKEECHSSPS